MRWSPAWRIWVTGRRGPVRRGRFPSIARSPLGGSLVGRWMRLCLLLATTMVALLAAAGCGSAPPGPPGAGDGAFAGLIDVGGGRRIYLECRGVGGPTVVLIAGYGNRGSAW